jgi:AcrR family transcriptional regulator
MDKRSIGSVDPRVKRTHFLLRQALEKLLNEKEFDKISVQDIAETATLNRATFYDHYPDKYALLECMVAHRFTALLDERGVKFDGGCIWALRAMVLGVCDYLANMPPQGLNQEPQMEPHMEAAVISVVTQMILTGMEGHAAPSEVPSSMLAATLSWAIFGAAKDWARNPERCPSETMADQVMTLLGPLFAAAYERVSVSDQIQKHADADGGPLRQ